MAYICGKCVRTIAITSCYADLAILEDQGDPGRWKFLFQPAMQELRARHPAIDIQLNYTTHTYNQASRHILTDTHISKLKQR